MKAPPSVTALEPSLEITSILLRDFTTKTAIVHLLAGEANILQDVCLRIIGRVSHIVGSLDHYQEKSDMTGLRGTGCSGTKSMPLGLLKLKVLPPVIK